MVERITGSADGWEDMDTILLEDIGFEVDLEALYSRLRLKPGSGYVDAVRQLALEGQALARPKAVYGMASVGARGDDWVEIEGIGFASRVLRVNLDRAYRVFPYVATCGTELEEWANSKDDLLERFWAEALQEQALSLARRALSEDVQERFHPGSVSRMSPGSLDDWPLEQQAPLFALLGDVQSAVGVRLTESFLMLPAKSVSGILFPTEESFENCMLCPREGCPGRRAPYTQELYDRYRL
ncbi:MAG: vitamin B12 dependent methionine synthase [Anaerolineae bacterium]|nr:vitamin B12 dependent methionine synthase [Anaerolineae bacterium]